MEQGCPNRRFQACDLWRILPCTVTLGALSWIAFGHAQTAKPQAKLQLSEYHKQVWQVEDGLPENNVRQIAQGPDGKLLLATFSGVVSFDGQRFDRVGVNASDVNGATVNAILPDSHGNLWAGTDGSGVLRYSNGTMVNISEQAGLLHERIRTMMMDRSGVLWVAAHNGVERYVNGVLRRVDGSGMIAGDITTVFAETDVTTSSSTGMYFVTSQGLFLWTNDGLRHLNIPRQYGLPVAVYRDPQHHLWLGTSRQVLEVTDEELRDDNVNVRLVATTGTPVTALVGDNENNLWIGTRHSGLWRYQPNAKDGVSHWNSREGLDDESVRSIFIDDEGNLWIGMLSGGLSRWRKAAFAPYGRPEGFASSYAATAFADHRGDLWLGTWGQGLFRRRNGVTTPMPLPGMPRATPIRAVAEDRKGNVWVGTWFNGVYRYDGKEFKHFRLGIESPINAVAALLVHSDGSLWVGTYTGLQYFASGIPDKGTAKHLLETKLITCLLQDTDGSVLVGTSEGLFRVRDGRVETVQELPHPYVLSLTRDSRGGVWVGPRSGGLLNVRKDKAIPIGTVSQLAAYPVYNGVEDHDGDLWLGTSRGIVRVGVNDLHASVGDGGVHPSNLDIMIFGKGDGMRSSDCSGPSQPSGTRMPDGTLWFSTTQGFIHTTAYAEAIGPLTPSARIEGWTFSQDREAPLITGGTMNVDPSQTDLRIVFNARYLANPDRINFRYRLKGYDTDWTLARSRTAHYQHLSPGHYEFEVQARMGGAAWNSPAAVLAVHQEPHCYQAWYFYMAVSILGVLIASALYRRRVKQVRASVGLVMEERNRIARECHDTLMAGFSAVSWQIEATSKQLASGSNMTNAAVASCDLARSMLLHCQAEARRIIWDLRDSDELTGDLSMALRRAIDAHYRESSVQVKFSVTGNEFALPPSTVHHLVCIGQEAIANALRHAHPMLIEVQLQFQAAAVRMQVQDDGCGFQSSKSFTRQGHFGVAVMEERARKIGGDFSVQSQIGNGTLVAVRIPFLPEKNTSEAGQSSGNSIVRWIGI